MFWRLLKLGTMKRCPNCGHSPLFNGYLTVRPICDGCGLDFQTIRSDDMPAYFTIAIVGHLLLPLIYWMEVNYHLSMGLHFSIWLPATIILTLGMLPSIKGIAMGIVWYTLPKQPSEVRTRKRHKLTDKKNYKN
ncbi:DUF983 domain-containing protein [Candidatus Paracaedibacter symbiosus]|uniref:DUF983 domain-containing protein n=1 Tax=Candidatus Paracaedibacter symbiosus TaxID=244582 RepID=UPI000689B807|nr:DUF983 domain-containing protein [Candidatus Paracaedibacter symbiosus]